MPVKSGFKAIAQLCHWPINLYSDLTGVLNSDIQDEPASDIVESWLRQFNWAGVVKSGTLQVMPWPIYHIQLKQSYQMQLDQDELSPRVGHYYRLTYTDPEQLLALIKAHRTPWLGPLGQVATLKGHPGIWVLTSQARQRYLAELIHAFDKPKAQVELKVRIVEVNETGLKELGITHGEGSHTISTEHATGDINLPINNPAGQFAIKVGNFLGGAILDLQLQAIESEGEGKVVASPQLWVMDQSHAHIAQGKDVPYLSSAGASGATQVQFKQAVLGVDITPRVLNSDEVNLKIKISKDAVAHDLILADGVPIIDTREIRTDVTMRSGDVLVLGGIRETMRHKSTTGIPLLSHIPFLGALFRSHTESNETTEVLVFVEPSF